ncbi:MAG: putative potassium/hydrogen antiporter [Gemmatimonadetes bacterium]|nr:putative potassium/hydrogen antiporter [Gemmatimonadota bacterium]
MFGLSLSVASTVVLLRNLEDRGALDSVDGRIAVGWLIVEDLATVLALVLLPPLASALGGTTDPGATAGSIWATLGITLIKVAAFVALMLVVGRRAVPRLLERVTQTGSRELFTLAVLAVALGIAFGASALFGVSFALGAFFAGVIVSESAYSHEAATNALPLQDAFAVLFFVSVGMLFDPTILVRQPLEVLAVVAIIIIGKSLASLLIVLAFRYPLHTALHISASLAQIGEFSFILAALGVSLKLLPPEAQSLIVAGALLSITLNPIAFTIVDIVGRRALARHGRPSTPEPVAGPVASRPPQVDPAQLDGHAVLVGYGRVGAPVADELAAQEIPFVVVEQSRDRAEEMRVRGLPVIAGDATREEVLVQARPERARLVIVASPDAYETRAILALVRRLAPHVEVIVRAYSEEERAYLESHGATRAIVAERALGVGLARYALRYFGSDGSLDALAPWPSAPWAACSPCDRRGRGPIASRRQRHGTGGSHGNGGNGDVRRRNDDRVHEARRRTGGRHDRWRILLSRQRPIGRRRAAPRAALHGVHVRPARARRERRHGTVRRDA